jgi:hypothetical protein
MPSDVETSWHTNVYQAGARQCTLIPQTVKSKMNILSRDNTLGKLLEESNSLIVWRLQEEKPKCSV